MDHQAWLKTVEEFFREKNRVWLQGEEGTLLHFLSGTPAECHSFQEVRALRQALPARDIRYRKAKTHLQVMQSKWNPDGETATVDLIENVRFFYEQKGDIGHESRRSVHRLTLLHEGGSWKVARDIVNSEPKMLREAPTAAEQAEVIEETDAEPATREMRGRYDRVRAFKYAELWWNGFNPAYAKMEGNDCTNYISQVVHAGGMPQIHSGSRSNGWWYRGKNWSFSWTVAHSFKLALPRLLHAQEVADPRQLKVGDIICYDWDGDGRWQHNTVVVDFDAYGRPLVNAHTIASHRRYWDYRDSYAYTARTKYAFYHIPDNF
ncbi:amidase domain-containing protein [Tumebacillus avium]|nr:amidase domain-containing protein [Tumebacillus avium]